MLISLEIRWFFPGTLPDAVKDWFFNILPGPEVGSPDSRIDTYMHIPDRDGVSIKLREERLEIKSRTKCEILADLKGIQGQKELWVKWSCKDGPEMDEIRGWLFPRGPWLEVKKRRWQRKNRLNSSTAQLSPAPRTEILETGIATELTELFVQDKEFWTIMVESFALDDAIRESLLLKGLATLFTSYPGPSLKTSTSFGYSHWLSRNFLGDTMDADHFHDLATREYEYLTQLFLQNEEMGEKRITFFTTVTAGLGAAAILAREKMGAAIGPGFNSILLVVSVAWLLMGYLTFVRILQRNIVTDGYKVSLARLRKYFVSQNDPRHRYLPYSPYKDSIDHHGRLCISFNKGKGGYAELIAVLNCIIAGTFGWLFVELLQAWILPNSPSSGIIFAALGIVLPLSLIIITWRVQQQIVRTKYAAEDKVVE